jgi:hypothetical protein
MQKKGFDPSTLTQAKVAAVLRYFISAQYPTIFTAGAYSP